MTDKDKVTFEGLLLDIKQRGLENDNEQANLLIDRVLTYIDQLVAREVKKAVELTYEEDSWFYGGKRLEAISLPYPAGGASYTEYLAAWNGLVNAINELVVIVNKLREKVEAE